MVAYCFSMYKYYYDNCNCILHYLFTLHLLYLISEYLNYTSHLFQVHAYYPLTYMRITSRSRFRAHSNGIILSRNESLGYKTEKSMGGMVECREYVPCKNAGCRVRTRQTFYCCIVVTSQRFQTGTMADFIADCDISLCCHFV